MDATTIPAMRASLANPAGKTGDPISAACLTCKSKLRALPCKQNHRFQHDQGHHSPARGIPRRPMPLALTVTPADQNIISVTNKKGRIPGSECGQLERTKLLFLLADAAGDHLPRPSVPEEKAAYLDRRAVGHGHANVG